MMMILDASSMNFLSLDIYEWKYQDFLESIKNPQEKTLIFTPNPEMLLRAERHESFLDVLKKATYLTPDANGLYTGALIQEGSWYLSAFLQTLFHKKILRERYGELIKWSDLTRDLTRFAEETGKKILMIDNYRITTPQNDFEIIKKSTQENLPSLFAEKFPNLSVHIVFDGEGCPEDIAQVIQQENISYVFSCIGMQKQEERLLEIFDFLPETQKVVGLWVGASFDFLLGLQKRAPKIFQKLGLEWLYRLMVSPRKHTNRVLDALYHFPKSILQKKENTNA